jgi:hypothetical protein
MKILKKLATLKLAICPPPLKKRRTLLFYKTNAEGVKTIIATNAICGLLRNMGKEL